MSRLGRGFPNNALMRPILATLPVVYDATGVGQASAGGGTLTWSHTIAGNAVLVGVHTGASSGVTAKVGSTSMIQLGSTFNYAASHYLWLFGLLAPPTGAQTMTVTGTSANSNTNSVSYRNVVGFGTVTTASGSTTSAAQSVSSTVGQMVFQMFGNNASPAISAYNQTTRWNEWTTGATYPLVIGDAPGSSTVNFTGTVGSGTWGGVAVPLIA